PPTPNPAGTASAQSATQITWRVVGAADTQAGLHISPYSFDNGNNWQAADSYVRNGLSANTQYSQTVVLRDAVPNLTTPNTVTARTLALAPNVTADKPTGTWLGPSAVTITLTNDA